MPSGEDNASVKDMMQKLAAKFEDKWDMDKNPKFEDTWDISKNPTFEDKWDVSKNSATPQKKNAALKEILHSVADKLSDKWDIHEQKKAQKGDVSAARSIKEGDQKNLDNESNNNNAKMKKAGSVQSSSEAGGSESLVSQSSLEK